MIECGQCGRFEDSTVHGVQTVRRALERDQLCFKCHFWKEVVRSKDDPRSLRCFGIQYWTRERPSDIPFSAFDGADYQEDTSNPDPADPPFDGDRHIFLESSSGEKVTSPSLWRVGDVPDWLKAELPDNVIFMPRPNPLADFKVVQGGAWEGVTPTSMDVTRDGRFVVLGHLVRIPAMSITRSGRWRSPVPDHADHFGA